MGDGFDGGVKVGRERASVEGGDGLLDFVRVAGAEEGGAETRVVGDEADGEFGEGDLGFAMELVEGGELFVGVRAEVGALGAPAGGEAIDEREEAGDEDGHVFCGGGGENGVAGGDVERVVVVGDEDGVEAVEFADEAGEVTGIVAGDADVAGEAGGFGFAEELERGGAGEIEGGFEIEELAVADIGAVAPPVVPVGFVKLKEVDGIAAEEAEVFAELNVHRFDGAEVRGDFEVADLGGDDVAIGRRGGQGVAEDGLRGAGAIERRRIEIADAEVEGAVDRGDGAVEAGETGEAAAEGEGGPGFAGGAEGAEGEGGGGHLFC